jgi:hypothetical protein
MDAPTKQHRTLTGSGPGSITDDPSAYIGLAAAVHLCPSIRRGKPVHPATLTRWILKGVRLQSGAPLRLAAKRFPGGWATTSEAVGEFVDALTRDRCGEPGKTAPPTHDARRRANDATERRLDSIFGTSTRDDGRNPTSCT